MKTNKNIIWIASYPKSGNTWIRIFLSNYLKKEDQPFELNNLITDGIASGRNIFEEATGLDSSELTNAEIDNLRPGVYKHIAGNSDNPLYIKIHDANIKNAYGEYLVPHEITLGVIYIIRNPLDVAVSFAYHSGIEIDKAVEFLCNEKAAFCSSTKLLPVQMQQTILTWNSHVASWTDDPRLNLLIVRYEDLFNDTGNEFAKIIRFIGLPVDKYVLQLAIENSKFDKVKELEQKNGFGEKAIYSKNFFRKGTIGDWENHLSGYHVKRIKEVNREMMMKYGYL